MKNDQKPFLVILLSITFFACSKDGDSAEENSNQAMYFASCRLAVLGRPTHCSRNLIGTKINCPALLIFFKKKLPEKLIILQWQKLFDWKIIECTTNASKKGWYWARCR